MLCVTGVFLRDIINMLFAILHLNASHLIICCHLSLHIQHINIFLMFNRARRRGRGAVNRCLELLPSSPTHSDGIITPPASNLHDNPFSGELEIDEDAVFVECPMCQEMFPSDTINLHAADCPGKQSSSVSQDVTFVQCPLCQDMFPEEIITGHASLCSL